MLFLEKTAFFKAVALKIPTPIFHGKRPNMKFKQKNLIISFLSCLSFNCFSAVPSFSITPISSNEGFQYTVKDINDNGQFIGRAYSTRINVDDSVFTVIPTTSGYQFIDLRSIFPAELQKIKPCCINNNGQMIFSGKVNTKTVYYSVSPYENSWEITPITTDIGEIASINDINNQGEIESCPI